MKKLLFVCVALGIRVSALCQNLESTLNDSLVYEYAIVSVECTSFGGYCIHYENGRQEDFTRMMKFKKPRDLSQNAIILMALLKYMNQQGYALLASGTNAMPSPYLTTQYIFARKPHKPK